MRTWLVAWAALLLSGCSAVRLFDIEAAPLAVGGSQFGDNATVYVLRDETFAYSLYSIDIKVDGVAGGSLRRGQYLRLSVAPGEHEIVAAYPAYSLISPAIGLDGHFASKHTYYLLYSTVAMSDPGPGYFVGTRAVQYGFRQLSEEEAKVRLQTYEDKTEK